jgi:8-oxo-dGTP pyrophosphatase MutT (NUDIX family)
MDGDCVVLLENERQEWELPGGRLEAWEDPPLCLAREIAKELTAEALVGPILDCWLYEVRPAARCHWDLWRPGHRRWPMRVSHEHKRVGVFHLI